MKKLLSFLTILFFLLTPKVNAVVRINEVYPAPSSGSGETEWVELYNDENTTIDLAGYSLTDASGKKITISDISIGPFAYITAISTNVLNNSGGETITLKNAGVEIDTTSYTQTMTSDKTHARCPDGSGEWYILTKTTKHISNEEACMVLTPTPTSTPIPTPTSPTPTVQVSESPTPPIASPSNSEVSGVYLSEVMVHPATEEKEWVELYNSTTQSLLLQNWYIDDIKDGGSSPKTFTLSLPPLGYGVIEFSNAIFNNTGDTVRLVDNVNIEKDKFSYTSSKENKTYSRIVFPSGSFCETEPSRGTRNNDCVTANSASSPSPVVLGLQTTQDIPLVTDTYAVTSAEDIEYIVYQDHLSPVHSDEKAVNTPKSNSVYNKSIEQKPLSYASVTSSVSGVFFFSSLNLFYTTIKLFKKLKTDAILS